MSYKTFRIGYVCGVGHFCFDADKGDQCGSKSAGPIYAKISDDWLETPEELLALSNASIARVYEEWRRDGTEIENAAWEQARADILVELHETQQERDRLRRLVDTLRFDVGTFKDVIAGIEAQRDDARALVLGVTYTEDGTHILLQQMRQGERDRDEARAALDRVRALHSKNYPTESDSSHDCFAQCDECTVPWPCPTACASAPAPADAEDGGR